MVLLSPQAVDSMWVRREVAFALYEKRYHERIIPLTYKPCNMTPVEWLNLSQKVDFTGDFADGCQDLFADLGYRTSSRNVLIKSRLKSEIFFLLHSTIKRLFNYHRLTRYFAERNSDDHDRRRAPAIACRAALR